ncbi:hypothetical protein [Photobacterium satsumensis]|uniref:hypothetical protein n=1 Tax=Photobacterium satsumensis TaxID=2910239 RepID=UPI003D14D15D
MLFRTCRIQSVLVSCFLALLIVGCSSSNEDDENVGDFANEPVKEESLGTTEVAITQSLPLPKGKAEPLSYPMFLLANLAFYREGLQYESPAQFTMHYDGSWEFYADRIANDRKTSASEGVTWVLWLRASYYGERDCSGPILYAENYQFYSIGYTEDKRNIKITGLDIKFSQKASQIRCIRYYQEWTS